MSTPEGGARARSEGDAEVRPRPASGTRPVARRRTPRAPDGSPRERAFDAARRRVAECFRRARAIHLTPYEGLDARTLLREVREPVFCLTAECHAVAATLVRVEPDDPQRSAVADIAFLATTSLQRRLEQLRSLDERVSGWGILAALAGALRCVEKSAMALDHTLADALGAPRALEPEDELAHAIAVRVQYARLRRVIGRELPGSRHALTDRLRAVGGAIASLRGRAIYAELRIADRRALCGLQERILAFLRDPTPATGRGLWWDLVALGDTFAQISHRQELREHDRGRVGAALREALTTRVLSTATHVSLGRCEGLDDTLDALLRTCPADSARWLPTLRRLMLTLGPRR